MSKSKRWARGALQSAVKKLLGKPRTVKQVADELEANRNSVNIAVRRIGKATGKTVKGPMGPPAALFKRA